MAAETFSGGVGAAAGAAVGTLPSTPPPAPAAPPPAPAPAAAPAAPAVAKLPEGAQPKLVVIRGQRIKQEFPIYEGHNFIGRADEKPVDIDLEDQEPPDRIWCSRQHALITFEDLAITIEDLNSANGTFVNRNRVYPGQKQNLKPNDVIQIGTVQMKVTVS
jgi:pSer/pThr/pTyr-binding forkhead associated (FHA) protein